MKLRQSNWVLSTFFMLMVASSCSLLSAQDSTKHQSKELKIRNFEPANKNDWHGNGISYGPYRDGQGPGGAEPTKEQVAEDLKQQGAAALISSARG